MVSSLAALRGRGGGALGSDRFLFVVEDHTSHQKRYSYETPCLRSWRMK